MVIDDGARGARETLDTELTAAVEILRAAGDLTLGHFKKASLAVETKDDGTPVTAADRAVERFVRDQLARRYPGDGILGEEEAERPSETGRRWIVDPIDGTKAFARGVGTFSNLLALEDPDGIALGVINIPALGETVYAARGLGCFWNGSRATVSSTSKLGGSYLSSCSFSNWPDDLLLAVKHAGAELRTWGDGYGYALVATGRLDAMVDPEAALYDLAPMPVILSEAGGRFTDWSGSATPDGGNGIGTNGALHDELLELLGLLGAGGVSEAGGRAR